MSNVRDFKRLYVHPSAILETERVDKDTKIGAFSHIHRGAKIGEECDISDYCVVEEDVVIGNNVKLGHNVIIHKNVKIANNCFIGPNCIIGEPLAVYYTDKNYKNREVMKVMNV